VVEERMTKRQPRACCMAMTAECMACTEGLTVEEFCSKPELAATAAGCPRAPAQPQPRACCMAMTAECMACSENLTVEAFCATVDLSFAAMTPGCPKPAERSQTLIIADHTETCYGPFERQCMLYKPSPDATEWSYFYDWIDGFERTEGVGYVLEVGVSHVPNPPADGSDRAYRLIKVVEERMTKRQPRACCMAMTAECMACTEGLTVEEFCSKPELAATAAGCPRAPAQPQPRACCMAMTAECMACSENLTVEAFCATVDLSFAAMTPGCPKPAERSQTLIIADHTETCYGPFERQCMLYKPSPDATEWSYFYDWIDGFERTEGVGYVLEVGVSHVPNPPADGSDRAYRLIKVVEERMTKQQPRACCMAMTAECMACSMDMTVEELCKDEKLAVQVVDCHSRPAVSPSVVRYLTAKPKGPGAVLIQWVPPQQNFDCGTDWYIVEYRKVAAGKLAALHGWKRASMPTANFLVLEGLVPGDRYQVRVAAVSFSGDSSRAVQTRVRAGRAKFNPGS